MTPPDRDALVRLMANVLWWRNTGGYQGCVLRVRAQLAALEAAGCVVMPARATDEMICAGDEVIITALNEHPADVTFSKGTPAARCHDAMVANSPYRSRT